jgi:hypothetical protein
VSGISNSSNALKIRKFVLLAGALIFCFGFVCWLMGEKVADLFYDATYYRYASMPVTPCSQLDKWAGTNKIVRLRVKLLGDPAVTDSIGDKLAYKSVVQSSESHGITYDDDWWWIPSTMEASDGELQVTLDLQHKTLDHDYIPKRATGIIRDHKIPPDIAALIVPDFEKLEPYGSDDIAVYTLDKGAIVTVFGVVEKKEGRFIVQPPKRAFSPRLIVSPLAAAALNGRLKTGVLAIGISIATIILTLAAIFGLAAWNERKMRREQEHSQEPPPPPDAWNS